MSEEAELQNKEEEETEEVEHGAIMPAILPPKTLSTEKNTASKPSGSLGWNNQICVVNKTDYELLVIIHSDPNQTLLSKLKVAGQLSPNKVGGELDFDRIFAKGTFQNAFLAPKKDSTFSVKGDVSVACLAESDENWHLFQTRTVVLGQTLDINKDEVKTIDAFKLTKADLKKLLHT